MMGGWKGRGSGQGWDGRADGEGGKMRVGRGGMDSGEVGVHPFIHIFIIYPSPF